MLLAATPAPGITEVPTTRTPPPHPLQNPHGAIYFMQQMQCKDIKMKHIFPFYIKLETKGNTKTFQLIQWQWPACTEFHFSMMKGV